jgi:hypothetical protein
MDMQQAQYPAPDQQTALQRLIAAYPAWQIRTIGDRETGGRGPAYEAIARDPATRPTYIRRRDLTVFERDLATGRPAG